ncbi:MAG: hypothetical protein HFG20_10230 [Anaerotruncus sp.]|nr:hypothetical protein [Anaerotruncus sp.]
MESVLREPQTAEIDELFAQTYNLSSDVVYFPVRHHSPACAYHLLETVRLYQPDAVLVEGPSDAGQLLEGMADPLAKPPFCIYYSYDDATGLVDESKGKYRAYYPFLAYSPEYVVLCEAHRRKIAAQFIDLPYASQLVNGRVATAQFNFQEEELGATARYTEALARKAGCRSFSEFWESRFELDARARPTEQFVKGLLALGSLLREMGVQDKDGQMNLLRERFMAQQIAAARGQYQRILVVAGAFHIRGLLTPQQELPALRKHVAENAAAYLMPYTFHEADSRTGYSAGMPFPAYYQNVWERMQHGEKKPYTAAVLGYIVQTARYARKTQPVSLPDEINAYRMACSLAALRDKPAPGVYELLDGVRSAFVKGDINSSATFELDFLSRLLSGMGAGAVPSGGCMPPVVLEFRAQCARFRLKTGTVERQQATLDIVKNPAHAEKSRFLHQLRFLETGFCQLESGPDYVNGTDKNLVREQWICRYSTAVETRLIDLSVYGATLAQVCAARIREQLTDQMAASALGKLLISVQVLGVQDFYQQQQPLLMQIVQEDGNFQSLCKLVQSLRYLAGMQRMLVGEVHPVVQSLLRVAFLEAAEQIPVMKTVQADQEESVCVDMRELYAFTVEQPQWCDGVRFAELVEHVLEDSFCNSRFYGVCLAIRHRQGALDMQELCNRITGYLETAMGEPEQAASFICGVFLAGRDALFADPQVLEQLDRVIARMSETAFLEVLANLRYAFTSFLPTELDRVGRMVAQLHHLREENLRGSDFVSQQEAMLAMKLDAAAASELRKWGLVSDG